MRVRQVVNELRGEKVDIVPYSDDPQEFVMRALAPAKVREVRIHEDTGIAEVIVPDFQLSLAIGKEGQNARLAARLTGWRVDIKSETQLAEEEAGGGYAEGEWVEGPDGQLMWQPAGAARRSAPRRRATAPSATGKRRGAGRRHARKCRCRSPASTTPSTRRGAGGGRSGDARRSESDHGRRGRRRARRTTRTSS